MNNSIPRRGKTIAIVTLALLAGGILSQMPSALADDSDNPLGALWDAIFDLQSRDEDLQAQIDELRAEKDALVAGTGSEPAFVSDLYAEIKVEATEDGNTLVYVTAGNNGPDRAAGVKLTAFYLMPLFEINSIDGDLCEDMSRGIIECALGTLEDDQETVVTIDATPRESGKENTWTVDISTTTDDSDYSNNHVDYSFETGSDESIEIQIEQPVEEEESVDDPEEEVEPEQDKSGSNNTETESWESNGNQTSTEETQSGNQTSAETEETDDSGSNNNGTESEDPSGESSTVEKSSSEESDDGATEHEGQDASSSETGEEQAGSDSEQGEQSGADESGVEESIEGSSGEESGSEESEPSGSGNNNDEQQESSEDGSSEQESDESGSEGESGDNGSESGGEESPSQ